MDQRQLVERARRGDHDAFATLVGVFVVRLDAAARLILRDRNLAQDAVQEGFLGAWRNLPTLRDPDRFEGWLRRLVFRACIATIRRQRRRVVEVALLPNDASAPVGDLETIIADRDVLDEALRRLRPEWRAVVVLHYFLGMPLPDVAETLGIPLGTAKSRHFRSLEEMRSSITAALETPQPRLAGGQLA